MGVGAGLYMCDVVKKSSRSLSHLLMSSCPHWVRPCWPPSCNKPQFSSRLTGRQWYEIQDRAQICAVKQSTAHGSKPDVVLSVPWIPYVNRLKIVKEEACVGKLTTSCFWHVQIWQIEYSELWKRQDQQYRRSVFSRPVPASYRPQSDSHIRTLADAAAFLTQYVYWRILQQKLVSAGSMK